MADPNIGQLTASTWEKVKGKPEDNIFTSQWLLAALKEAGGIVSEGGGSQIEESLEYAENTTFKSYSDLEVLDTTRVDVFDAARFAWKELGGTIVYSNLEQKRNQGAEQKFALIASKINNAKMSHDATWNRQAYGDGTGNGSKDFTGLDALVPAAPTSGTVGGINRATFSFWRSQQVTDGGSSYSTLRASMRTLYNSCSRGAYAEHPTHAVASQSIFEAYEGTLTSNERFTSKEAGEGGFKNEVLKFKGLKIAYDEDFQDSDELVMFNVKNLKFRTPAGGWKQVFPEVEPANQTATVVRIATVGNFCMNSSRRHGRITSIA